MLFRNLTTSLGKVETDCQGGQVSPRAVVPRAVETGCRGQVSPRAVAPSEEEEEEEEEED
jgi:hypothetical protein